MCLSCHIVPVPLFFFVVKLFIALEVIFFRLMYIILFYLYIYIYFGNAFYKHKKYKIGFIFCQYGCDVQLMEYSRLLTCEVILHV